MANYDGVFSASPYNHILRLVVNQASQNVGANTSVDTWALYAIKNTTYGGISNYANPWSVNINGQVWSGTFTHNFSGQPIGYTQLIASGTTNPISHASNGTKVTAVSASASSSMWGSASCGGNFTQTTIPRSSIPTFSPSPGEIGSNVTITTNRLSSGYTHTIEYNFNGAGWNTIATGVGASTVWAVPSSLLTDITNAASASASIRTTTFSGATQIGSPTVVALTLNVPASVVPTIGAITDAEATPGLAANIGAYVQGLTTLSVGITGAAGASGSTITGYKIEVVGQPGNVLNAQSGTLPLPIAASGTVTLKATVTDSRGRTASITKDITVLAYAPPTINSITVERALGDGTPDADDGTYGRFNIDAFVQSLIVGGTQKNAINYKLYSRSFGAGSWTLRETVTPGGVSFVGFDLVSGLSLGNSYDLRIEIYDDFSTSSVQFTIPVATVFMHWDGALGVGILTYRQQGALDVNGEIYQQSFKVLDTRDYDEIQTKITEKRTSSIRIPLPLAVTLVPRSPQTFGNPLDPTIPFWITKNSSGVVTFEGLGTGLASLSAGTTFATLPVGYRPATTKRFPISFNNGRSSVTINTNGTMSLGANITATSDFFSLANAWFYEADVENSFTWNTPTLLNSWLVSGSLTPQWALDPYGCIILRGRAAKAGTWTDTQTIFSLSPHTFSQTEVIGASSDSAYGFIRVGNASGGSGSNVMIGGSVTGVAISLDGIILCPSGLDSNFSSFGYGGFTNLMGDIPLSNGWLAYNVSTFRTPQAWLRSDGLVLNRGLIATGTLGNHSVIMPKPLHAWQGKIWERPSNNATGRLDLYSPASVTTVAYPGALVPSNGSTTWFSTDSTVFQIGS